MASVYLLLLEMDREKIAGKTYNAGYENHSVLEIAESVKSVIGQDVQIELSETDDNRSYHVSSDKIKSELGFVAQHSIQDAVSDIRAAFERGLLPNSLSDERYFNIKKMQSINLT